jgi:hypothetical protein
LSAGGGRIGPGQKIVYLAVGVTVDDLGDDVGQIGMRFDGTELASLDLHIGVAGCVAAFTSSDQRYQQGSQREPNQKYQPVSQIETKKSAFRSHSREHAILIVSERETLPTL